MRKLAFVLVVLLAACKKGDDKPKSGVAPLKDGKVDVDNLAAAKAPGFTFTVMHKDAQTVTLSAAGDLDGKKVNALISAGACELAMLCPALDEAEFAKRKDDLMTMLSSGLKADPNTVFEIANKQVAGQKTMTVYTLGFAKQDGSTMSAHEYDVYWNDGQRLVTLMITDGDWPDAETFDEFKGKSDRGKLERAAEALLPAMLNAF